MKQEWIDYLAALRDYQLALIQYAFDLTVWLSRSQARDGDDEGSAPPPPNPPLPPKPPGS